MGQKINTTSFRLKKRLNWNNIYCSHNFRDFSKFLYVNQNIKKISNQLLLYLNLFINNNTILKDAKNYRLFTNILHQKYIYSNYNYANEFNFATRNTYLEKQTNSLSKLYLNQQNISCEFGDLFLSKPRRKFVKFQSLYYMQQKFLLLSPKLLAQFVLRQLKVSYKLKNRSFNRNFQTGLVKFANTLLALFPNKILGLKIICSGKWKKTRTGRKQKFILRFGKVQKATLANIIYYNKITQETKFGSCGVKVWISYKNLV